MLRHLQYISIADCSLDLLICREKKGGMAALGFEVSWCTVVSSPVSSCASQAYTSTTLFAGDVKAFCAVQVFYIKVLCVLAGFPLATSSQEHSISVTLQLSLP